MNNVVPVFRIRSVTISQATREASYGPEYLMLRYQAQWPLDDYGNPTDHEWLAKHTFFANRFGVTITMVTAPSPIIRVWHASILSKITGNGNKPVTNQ